MIAMTQALRLSASLLGILFLIQATQAAEPAPTRATAQYETRFLTRMIDHHAMAVMMAGMCEERAVHAELTGLCMNIVQAQTSEIGMMQALSLIHI